MSKEGECLAYFAKGNIHQNTRIPFCKMSEKSWQIEYSNLFMQTTFRAENTLA